MIFISYRRGDSAGVAGRIYDKLEARFGKREIFMDVDSIPPGANFEQILADKVRESDVMLVIIGQNWVGQQPKSRTRRIDEATDFVRIEVQLALRLGVYIIPLLVSGAAMPNASDLPPSVRPLASRQAIPVGDNPNFHRDMDRVTLAIETQKELTKHQREVAAQRRVTYNPTLALTGEAPGGLESRLTALLGATAKHIISAMSRAFGMIIFWGVIVGILAAAITEATGAWLTHQFPPSALTHLSAGVIGILAGGLVAVALGLQQVLRAIIVTIELIVQEAERLGAEALDEVGKPGTQVVGSPPSQGRTD